jgi:uncharacterized protein YjaG (DUF416 family)
MKIFPGVKCLRKAPNIYIFCEQSDELTDSLTEGIFLTIWTKVPIRHCTIELGGLLNLCSEQTVEILLV